MRFGRFLLGLGLAAGATAAWRRWRPGSPAGSAYRVGLNGRPGTALITGGSSGIGASFARQLASRGYNLVLVARREERLQEIATQLRERFAVDTEVLTADLAQPDGVQRVEECIAGLEDLTLLVNNAGFGVSGKFARSEIDRQLDMVRVHDIASLRLARAALPGMVSRGNGTIINVASLAAFFPLPGNAAYSASKALLVNFSEGLQLELRGSGVQVQALCPGMTYSEFHDRPDLGQFERHQVPEFPWMSADQVVEESLGCLERGEVVCVPGTLNQIGAVLARTSLAAWLMRLIMSQMGW